MTGPLGKEEQVVFGRIVKKAPRAVRRYAGACTRHRLKRQKPLSGDAQARIRGRSSLFTLADTGDHVGPYSRLWGRGKNIDGLSSGLLHIFRQTASFE